MLSRELFVPVPTSVPTIGSQTQQAEPSAWSGSPSRGFSAENTGLLEYMYGTRFSKLQKYFHRLNSFCSDFIFCLKLMSGLPWPSRMFSCPFKKPPRAGIQSRPRLDRRLHVYSLRFVSLVPLRIGMHCKAAPDIFMSRHLKDQITKLSAFSTTCQPLVGQSASGFCVLISTG